MPSSCNAQYTAATRAEERMPGVVGAGVLDKFGWRGLSRQVHSAGRQHSAVCPGGQAISCHHPRHSAQPLIALTRCNASHGAQPLTLHQVASMQQSLPVCAYTIGTHTMCTWATNTHPLLLLPYRRDLA